MNRRTLLAGSGSALSASFVGCLNRGVSGLGGEEDNGVTPARGTPPEFDEDCGPAEHPLSVLLTNEPGDSSVCVDGATPSFALENEREEALTITVDITTDDKFSETYTLAPGERIVEESAFEAASGLTGTVTVDEEESEVVWSDRSCYRHAITLVPDGIKNGWIKPFRGPGDTQHDCYAGDESVVFVRSLGEARTVEVTTTNLCTGEEIIETFELDGDETERAWGLVTDGGMYNLEATTHDDNSTNYEFHEKCWGVDITVEENGELSIYPVGID